MPIKIRQGFDIAPIIDKLIEARSFTEDGRAQFSGEALIYDKCKSYLTTALFEQGKSWAFMTSVIQRTMSSKKVSDYKTFSSTSHEISNELDKKYRRKMKVVFPIWGGDNLLTGVRKWDGVSINFNVSSKTSFSRKVRSDRAKQVSKFGSRSALGGHDFSQLPLAVCTVNAIDVFDAFELAENAISKELGLYSLMEERAEVLYPMFKSEKPISTILLAPHMTVHDEKGRILKDVYWRTNNWARNQKLAVREQTKIEKIQTNVEFVRKRIRKLPEAWQELATAALVRHYQAFSQGDLEATFLDGWRLLEAIGGKDREKSETLVKRASWFFEDVEEEHQFGLHLMNRRHLISHGKPVRADDKERLAFQMKEFVSPLLHEVLINRWKFKTIEELWAFCDLPVSPIERQEQVKQRQRQLKLIEYSVKFRREG